MNEFLLVVGGIKDSRLSEDCQQACDSNLLFGPQAAEGS
jgi:hypothetical protein